MDIGEKSERLAWDLDGAISMPRVDHRSSKSREALRQRFVEEQAERRLAACANTVARRAARRAKIGSFIVALVSLVILTITSLPSLADPVRVW